MARKMTKHIAISEETHKRLSAIKNGVGSTYDDMLILLLDEIKEGDESDFSIGNRLRKKLYPELAD